MGQYFVAVNKTKKEYVCSWCCGGFAKLIEWAVSPIGSLFVVLLRRSSSMGGGDFNGPRTVILDADSSPEEIAETIARGALREGQPSGLPKDSVVGRWAGDEVYLVGDYDESELYHEAFRTFRNISHEVVDAWNSLVDVDELKLDPRLDCHCSKATDEK